MMKTVNEVENWLQLITEKQDTLWSKMEKNKDQIAIQSLLSHERGSERSERAGEGASTAEGASEASSPEQVNE